MSRATFLLFGILAYLIFFATFLYLVAFVGNLPWVPLTVDRGGIVGAEWSAIAIDLVLVALFGLQHSIMARPAFKRAWTRIVPEPIERSIYVLAASLVLILMFLLWRPIPGTVWVVADRPAVVAIWGLFGLGWGIVLLSTFLISHFELFGLTQVWGHARGRPSVAPTFRTPFFYRLVRHPLYSGFILAFFAIPIMTVGHVLLAAAMFVYILIAIQHEERDLVTLFGDRYVDYRDRVGMLAPRLRRSRR
ncbi:methanethiol S-methyltransferase [Sphingomonas nostoxanthinifaciens]|uniref:methanethiol S-methyltransferase n=1 Tax=Sphingomonas nostoxanthinifaciens TaxID=2872652 RepID=UPI001CC1F074|nr:methanethiol S-methyltransferase [Sphingomonas nostoxanthinifaciens]UAK24691.1 isoprenylcysteine carboxylmethyltransferase family protein [Sphingomonas nostoxanthinifaciens]